MLKQTKILLTLNSSKISGIENFVLTLIKNLNNDKFRFIVAIPDDGDIVSEFKKAGVEYFIFNNNLKKPYNLKGIFNIFKFLAVNKFDIIHAQAGIVPCVLGMFFGVRYRIEHRHGLDFPEEQRENMKPLRKMYESVKKYFVNLTLTGCERDRQYLIEKFNYNPSKVITVYNGVEDFCVNASREKENSVITIGTIGRLMYQKSQETFIDMAKTIEDMNTGLNIVYEIWGEGELYSELDDRIKSYNLSDKIFLKGYARDLKDTYSRFDIFVLTSRFEGIPYVILKSMSARVPVVTTDAGGINEIITNEKNGLLVPRGDVNGLRESVLKLLNDKSFKDAIVQSAYEDYKNFWTVEKTIYKMEEVYCKHLQ